jgi:ABC-type glutathione transport system ATPase component
MALLQLDELTISLHATTGETRELVRRLNLSVEAQRCLCVVGESGSGKTVTAMSIIRLLEFVAPVSTEGAIRLDGTDLTTLDEARMRGFRGRRIGMVFQEALGSFNPAHRIGRQLIEAFRPEGVKAGAALRRRSALRAAAVEKATGLLLEVGLTDPGRVMDSYPHQLSGGMQQRVMIAMALMCDPMVLLADEPTTALDVSVQADILDLFRRIQRDHGTALVFITHDLAVASQLADDIAVMYRGELVEVGPASEIVRAPRHPYTRALLGCAPQLGVRRRDGFPSISPELLAQAIERDDLTMNVTRLPALPEPGSGPRDGGAGAEPLRITGLTRTFPAPRRRMQPVHALRGIDLEIVPGEFFGLVGESGSGKSTLGRIVAALDEPSAGEVNLGPFRIDSGGLRGREHSYRKHVQMIFQDPQSSLDSRHTVRRIIGEPLRELTDLGADAIDGRVRALVEEVELPESVLDRRPRQLSGGQRQRVALARAVAAEPGLIVADEPTSALDVSVQGQVMNLLLRLQRGHGLSLLFITHNLALVMAVADRVGVLRDGELVQVGTPEELLEGRQHEYTRRLLDANPALPEQALPAGDAAVQSPAQVRQSPASMEAQ